MKIETERLFLRPFRKEDLDDISNVLGDAETMSFYARPYRRDEIVKIIEKNIGTYESSGYGLFAIIHKETGRFLGDCGITIQIIDGEEEFEVGYRISKDYWGQGFAPEAAKAMIEFGFDELKLKRLCSYMVKNHHQSRRTAEKSGMELLKIYPNPRNRNLMTTVYVIYNKDEQVAAGNDR